MSGVYGHTDPEAVGVEPGEAGGDIAPCRPVVRISDPAWPNDMALSPDKARDRAERIRANSADWSAADDLASKIERAADAAEEGFDD